MSDDPRLKALDDLMRGGGSGGRPPRFGPLTVRWRGRGLSQNVEDRRGRRRRYEDDEPEYGSFSQAKVGVPQDEVSGIGRPRPRIQTLQSQQTDSDPRLARLDSIMGTEPDPPRLPGLLERGLRRVVGADEGESIGQAISDNRRRAADNVRRVVRRTPPAAAPTDSEAALEAGRRIQENSRAFGIAPAQVPGRILTPAEALTRSPRQTVEADAASTRQSRQARETSQRMERPRPSIGPDTRGTVQRATDEAREAERQRLMDRPAAVRAVDYAGASGAQMLTLGYRDELMGAVSPFGTEEEFEAREALRRDAATTSDQVAGVAGAIAGASIPIGIQNALLARSARLAPEGSTARTALQSFGVSGARTRAGDVARGVAEGLPYDLAYGYEEGENRGTNLAIGAVAGGLAGGLLRPGGNVRDRVRQNRERRAPGSGENRGFLTPDLNEGRLPEGGQETVPRWLRDIERSEVSNGGIPAAAVGVPPTANNRLLRTDRELEDIALGVEKTLRQSGAGGRIFGDRNGVVVGADSGFDSSLRRAFDNADKFGQEFDAPEVREIYQATEPVREALRQRYGPTVTLFRNEFRDRSKAVSGGKPTTYYADRRFAKNFGDPADRDLVEVEVPVERILYAGPASIDGGVEFLVANDSKWIPGMSNAVSTPQGIYGREAQASFPDGGKMQVRYRLMEADEVQPSHNAVSFQRNPAYPEGVQGRDYHRDPATQERVAERTTGFDPERLLDPTGLVASGPPIVTRAGIAVAGNERTMLRQRVPEMNAAGDEAYRAALAERAQYFGFTPEQVQGMRRPTLVREIADDVVDTTDPATLRELNTRSDQEVGKVKDQLSDAATRARQLTQSGGRSIDYFARTFDGTGRLRSYLTGPEGRQFVRELVEDGIIPRAEIPRFMDTRTGVLNAEAAGTVERMMQLAAIPDPDVVAAAPLSTLNKMEGAAPYIVQASRVPGWDITPMVRDAVRFHVEARSKGLKVGQLLDNAELFGREGEIGAEELARFLDTATVKQVRDLFSAYSRQADAARRATESVDMFGYTPPTPGAAGGDAMRRALASDGAAEQALLNLISRTGLGALAGGAVGAAVGEDPLVGAAVGAGLANAPALLRGRRGRQAMDEPTLATTAVVDDAGAPRVVYHGTSAGFRDFNPVPRNEANGLLYGPGHYFTENPALAGTYAKPYKDPDHLRASIARGEEVLADPAQASAHEAAREIVADLREELKIAESGSRGGPNVRPARLAISQPFRIDAPVDRAEAERVLAVASKFGKTPLGPRDVARLSQENATNQELYELLERAAGYDKGRTTNLLRRAGYDGITHIGGGTPDTGGAHRVWIAFDRKQVRSPWGDPAIAEQYGAASREVLGAIARTGAGAVVGGAVGGEEGMLAGAAVGAGGPAMARHARGLGRTGAVGDLTKLRTPAGAPRFYSRLEAAVTGGQNAAPASQWLRYLDNHPGGIAKGEREWTGVDEWLKTRGNERVTRQEVSDFLSQNRVQVGEVVLGGPNSLPNILNDRRNLYGESETLSREFYAKYGEGWRNRAIDPTDQQRWDDLEERIRMNEERERSQTDNPQYSDFQVPGAEPGTYREVLLTLNGNSGKVQLDQDTGEWVASVNGVEVYRGPHWDEANVLVHIRMDDRTLPNGERVLFVQEVQSDWHQRGRESGYQGGPIEAAARKQEYETLSTERDAIIAKYNEHGNLIAARGRMSPEDRAREHEISMRIAEVAPGTDARVPDAPFKNTDEWLGLAMKRVIDEAVSGGYDRVAWATGQQISKAVGSTNAIRHVEYNPDTRWFSAIDHNGTTVFTEPADPARVAEVIGADAATRLMDTPRNADGSHVLTGEQIDAGKSGNDEFYGRILPQWVKKYGKKVGVDVEPVRVPGVAEGAVGTRFVGPELSDEVLDRAHRMSFEGHVYPVVGDVVGQLSRTSNLEQRAHRLVSLLEDGNVMEAEVADVLRALGGTLEKVESTGAGGTNLSFRVTPALRETVGMKGQALYTFPGPILDALKTQTGQAAAGAGLGLALEPEHPLYGALTGAALVLGIRKGALFTSGRKLRSAIRKGTSEDVLKQFTNPQLEQLAKRYERLVPDVAAALRGEVSERAARLRMAPEQVADRKLETLAVQGPLKPVRARVPRPLLAPEQAAIADAYRAGDVHLRRRILDELDAAAETASPAAERMYVRLITGLEIDGWDPVAHYTRAGLDVRSWPNLHKFGQDDTGQKILERQVQRVVNEQGAEGVESWDYLRQLSDSVGADPARVMREVKRGPKYRAAVIAGMRQAGENVEAIKELSLRLAQTTDDTLQGQQLRQLLSRQIETLEQRNLTMMAAYMDARTNAGRDLNIHRMVAARSMDPVLWRARVQKVLRERGVVFDERVHGKRINEIIDLCG